MIRLINTFFYSGLLRPASGTWGSLAALAVGWGIEHYLGFLPLVAATILVTALGFWSIGVELKDRPGDDPSEIVIDEVAGMWLTLLFPAFGFWMRDMSMVWPGPVAAFLFFRLFDVTKPWLVGRADRRHDAPGVMLDDLWAGVFAGICTVIAAALYHIVLI
ncbi:phosphatidylglycerophosphatase A [Thalassobius vesicularis]|uniref:Phosphatidylglycerophosphatase A n=1 Tax=Thalassobius vesicularis TaxID=1294297 RepID=A0A4S3MC79_9RHOB|nr:phosphatidylglycerophosphatase A [Thalassobius vesicularis]THD74975.1 phosphatidylglycerophosphatase A [Thalassobius vesicularis]